jgi:hypothetical protein
MQRVLIIGPVSSTETVVIMRGEMCLLHVLKRETEHGSGHACYGASGLLESELEMRRGNQEEMSSSSLHNHHLLVLKSGHGNGLTFGLVFGY